jgi:hypothetical protein
MSSEDEEPVTSQLANLITITAMPCSVTTTRLEELPGRLRANRSRCDRHAIRDLSRHQPDQRLKHITAGPSRLTSLTSPFHLPSRLISHNERSHTGGAHSGYTVAAARYGSPPENRGSVFNLALLHQTRLDTHRWNGRPVSRRAALASTDTIRFSPVHVG